MEKIRSIRGKIPISPPAAHALSLRSYNLPAAFQLRLLPLVLILRCACSDAGGGARSWHSAQQQHHYVRAGRSEPMAACRLVRRPEVGCPRAPLFRPAALDVPVLASASRAGD